MYDDDYDGINPVAAFALLDIVAIFIFVYKITESFNLHIVFKILVTLLITTDVFLLMGIKKYNIGKIFMALVSGIYGYFLTKLFSHVMVLDVVWTWTIRVVFFLLSLGCHYLISKRVMVIKNRIMRKINRRK